ncbi:MAG TPA: FAD-dependent oxidoreductase [Slackia equolifaciens]|uniref:FAD-dependent oxidoreductase n=1 Tax=Slackia equolifaciens TaxID=498718 RepID=A0A9D3A1I3_9ACTN|nr:FAD-dependent oxidoreductase [Slackia equolifaciens]
MKKEIGRRSFLKGAAATMGAVAAMNLAGCGTSPSSANETQTEGQAPTDATAGIEPVDTYDCDIVVCGTGIAGMSAIVQAAQNGANVIAVEAADIPGGNGNLIGGCFAHDSSLQKEMGIDFEFPPIIANEMAATAYRVDGELWKDLYDNSGKNLDWLIENGVKFSGQVDDYGTGGIKSMHYFEGRGGEGYIKPMVAKAEELGVQFLYSTKAEHAVTTDGKITGVYAQNADGDWVQVNAKAVILATGGYGADAQMVSRIGYDPDNLWYFGVEDNDGGGWRIAMEMGAKDFTYHSADNAHAYIRAMPHEQPDQMPNCGLSMCGYLVWVNQDCKRFVREDCGARNFCQQNPPRWNQKSWYFVFDIESYKAACQMYGVDPEEGVKIMEESVATNEGDCLYQADSIEELAGFFDLDADALVAEIEKHNQFCKDGVDGDWSKDPSFLMPIENPPYYITKPETLFLMTIGAVFTDINGQALDENNDPIPGLYAIGVDGCMLYRNVYTIDVPASCCGNSVNVGRHAADHACASL